MWTLLFVVIVLAVAAVLAGVALWWRSILMPGRSFEGPLPPLDARLASVAQRLRDDLTVLASEIGPRNVSHDYEALVAAAEFLDGTLQDAGYEVSRETFLVDGKEVWNLAVERRGRQRPDEILLVGAHYDTVPGSPGANDNGSAVVATLELARWFAEHEPDRTIRFVLFVNEEAPYYMTEAMGSLRCAQACRERGEHLVGMISLETIGCYFDTDGSQRYPVSLLGFFYPRRGNFAAVVGNLASRRFVHTLVRALRQQRFPIEGIAAPNALKDIFRSDHAAFWSCGYPGVMITDTANFRYPHYHTAADTVDKIAFPALALLVEAIGYALGDVLNDRQGSRN